MKRHVLLADDDATNQKVALAMLTLLGVSATSVFNGEQVMQALEAEQFDLIFMDCQMAVMDGYAATAAVRKRELADPDLRRTPIVALTADATKTTRARCLSVGMDDCLFKPFTFSSLAAIVEFWIPRSAPASTEQQRNR